MKSTDNSSSQPSMLEAAINAVKDQLSPKSTAPITAALTETLEERLKKAWAVDSNFDTARRDTARVATEAEKAFESSALTFGKVLLEVLDSRESHGDFTKYVQEVLGADATTWNRCQYCLRVAKKMTNWQPEAKKDIVAEKEQKAAAAREAVVQAEKAAAEKAAQAAAAGHDLIRTPSGKVVSVKKLAVAAAEKAASAVKRAEKGAQVAAASLESTRTRTNQQVELAVIKTTINTTKSTLDGDVAAIAKTLKNIVSKAAEEQQPSLDFYGTTGTEVKTAVDELVNKAEQLAKLPRKPFGMTFSKKSAEKKMAVTA